MPWRFILIVFFVLGILGELYYSFAYGEFLKIKNVSVEGDDSLPIAAIQLKVGDYEKEKIFGLLPRDNFLFFEKSNLQASIVDAFPRVSDLNVVFDLSSSQAKILLSPRKEVAVLCGAESQETCLYIDKSGFAFAASPQTSGAILPSFIDSRPGQLALGKKVINESVLDLLIKTRAALTANDYKIDTVTLRPSDDFVVQFQEGFAAWFSLNDDPTSQVARLQQVLQQIVGEKLNQLDYVDLRVGNKIFYRFKGVVQ